MESIVNQEKLNLTRGIDPVNVPAVGLYETFGFEAVSMIAPYSLLTIVYFSAYFF